MEGKESAGLAIIYDGMILLAHTTGRKWNGGYGIPKGGLEKGESALDAAIRETWEEIGIKVNNKLIDPTEYTYVVSSRKYKYIKTVYWFIVEVDDLAQIGLEDIRVPKRQLQLKEINWAGFMTLSEAKKVTMLSQQPVLTALRNKGLLEKKTNLKLLKLFEQYTMFSELRNGPKGDEGVDGIK